MKTLFSLLLLIVFTTTGNTQSISINPVSFNAWGNVTHTTSASVHFKDFGVHYFHVFKSKEYGSTEYGNVDVYSGWSQSTLAISYIPINIADIFKIGNIYSLNRFPTDRSNRINFWLEAGFNIRQLRVSYVHISNGFGLFNKVNPGIDSIRFTIPLTSCSSIKGC